MKKIDFDNEDRQKKKNKKMRSLSKVLTLHKTHSDNKQLAQSVQIKAFKDQDGSHVEKSNQDKSHFSKNLTKGTLFCHKKFRGCRIEGTNYC